MSNANEPALDMRIRNIGAHGIKRWGLGRQGMYWVQSVPALLEMVRDAEDDLDTLSGACRWLVQHAAAHRAAIVDHNHTRLLAGEQWTTTDLASGDLRADDVVAAPAKYGSEAIGWVIARGDPDAQASLRLGVDAVAAVAGPAIRTRLDALAALAARDRLVPELIGRSPAIVSVRQAVARAAAVPFPVLIEGESGTGKELVARALHRLSPRRDRRFCALNCAALADELVEAELFGHTRGAFTGAVGPRTGLFEDAHAGTLFMDEVSELSSRAQAKLLRAVQEREVRRVGENVTRPINVRLVAATNRPLSEAVQAGRFRADLQFRLAVVRIDLPPLRERLEDVPVLAQTFWKQLVRETGKRAWLAPDALAALCRHAWPGNVRELQNVVSSLVVLAPERGRVGARHVRLVFASQQPTLFEVPVVPLEVARRTFERRTVATALARHAGRRTAAARELGLSRQGLTKAIKRLGLTAPDDRGVA
jgi:transcriptional regulator with PAS, ATPase and Fis domain